MEQDVFSHLLDIENSASTLVFDAQKEADKRIATAKAEADKTFKLEYEKIIADLEDDFLQKKQRILDEQESEYKKYDEKLDSLKQQQNEFVEFLNKHFFRTNNNG